MGYYTIIIWFMIIFKSNNEISLKTSKTLYKQAIGGKIDVF